MAGLLAGWACPPRRSRWRRPRPTPSLRRGLRPAAGGQAGPVRLASSGYHLPRCLLLLRLAGVRATACPPPPAPRWPWYWRLREALALPYDAVLMALRRVGLRR